MWFNVCYAVYICNFNKARSEIESNGDLKGKSKEGLEYQLGNALQAFGGSVTKARITIL